MEQEELVELGAVSTAVAAPLDVSRRSINYLINYDPGIIYTNNYQIKDLDNLLNIYDDVIKFLGEDPKVFDKKIIDDLLNGLGILGNTHFDVAERTEDFLTDAFVQKNPLDAEKNIGKVLKDLIELEESVSGPILKFSASGVDAHGLSLFESANDSLTHVIDQGIDNLKKLSNQPSATPLDIVKQLQDGKFSNIVGAQQEVFDIGRTLIGHMTWAKVGTITRGVVVETAVYSELLQRLTNLTNKEVKQLDKLAKDLDVRFRNLEDLENVPVTRNRTIDISSLKLMQDNLKDFINTRYDSYLKRDADFYWRINPTIIEKEERAIFAASDYIRRISDVIPEDIKTADNIVMRELFTTDNWDLPIGNYLNKSFDSGYEAPLKQPGMQFADDAVLLKAPDASFNKLGRYHATPAGKIASIANDLNINLSVYSKRKGGLVPLSVVSLFNTDKKLEIWKGPGTTDEDLAKFVDAVTNKPLDNQGFKLTIEEPEVKKELKKPIVQQVRQTFVKNHTPEAIKAADNVVKTNPKFATKLFNNLSKLDVGQEVIEKGLAKIGTKYGAASLTGPAAAALAFYETLVLVADVTNAATKAIDKDIDFFDNFGKIDDKYSITYKLTKPFYENVFKGIRGISSDNK
tara:strand:+ start:11478 stop:13370 length:1893 start_codon:yes stop_codon:yes gene_type:complete